MPSRTLWISVMTNWIQRSTLKNAGGGERRAEPRRSARRPQFIIKVSSWRFYLFIYFLFIPFSLQKENLAKLHKRTINYILEKKNYGSGEGLEGNIRNHSSYMIYNRQEEVLDQKSPKIISWQGLFLHTVRAYGSLTAFFLFSFEAEIDAF